MEFNGLKIIGTTVIAAGLLTGAFLAGDLSSSGKSGAEPELVPTSIVERLVGQETHNGISLVDDAQSGSSDQGGHTAEAAEPQVQEPQTPAVVPTSAPAGPAPESAEPTPELGQPTPEAEPVNEAPYVASISPDDGVKGTEVDSSIVITFSEAMDKASTQAALNLSTGNCGAFSWNAEGTEMTFDPCADWTYGAEVKVQVYVSAADAKGLGMDQEFESEFMVLRQSTVKLYSQGALDGHVYRAGITAWDGPVNSTVKDIIVSDGARGFLSFDLSSLPEDLVRFSDAKLSIHQNGASQYAFSGTGNLMIRPWVYGELDATDYSGRACLLCGNPEVVISADGSQGWQTVNVTSWVETDWGRRDDQDSKSQYRLRFANDASGFASPAYVSITSGDSSNPLVILTGSSKPTLELTYIHP